jgi:hypothetical protein
MVGHEGTGERQPSDAGQQGECGVDSPDNAQGADLSSVVLDLKG